MNEQNIILRSIDAKIGLIKTEAENLIEHILGAECGSFDDVEYAQKLLRSICRLEDFVRSNYSTEE